MRSGSHINSDVVAMTWDVEVFMWAEISATWHHLLYIYYSWYQAALKTGHKQVSILNQAINIQLSNHLKINKKIKLIFYFKNDKNYLRKNH